METTTEKKKNLFFIKVPRNTDLARIRSNLRNKIKDQQTLKYFLDMYFTCANIKLSQILKQNDTHEIRKTERL